jgi:hypothetical protein
VGLTAEPLDSPGDAPPGPKTPRASRARRAGGWPTALEPLRSIASHPLPVLLGSVLIAVALNFWETRGQTLFLDEWGRLYYPHTDFESLLRWHTGHLVVLHVLLYKGIFGAFGAESYLPFRIIEAFLLGTCGLLFYALARSRAGAWTCVLATLILLFLGSAFEVTATPYGIVILLPIVFGLAALVCLERFPGRGDVVACLLLVGAVASQSDGLAFLVGGAVLLTLQRGRRLLTRSWVVLVPALLYVVWFAWYRLTRTAADVSPVHRTVQNVDPVHLHNLGVVPTTVLSACAAGLSAISGLFGSSSFVNDTFNLDAGYVLLGLLTVAAVWRVRSGWSPGRGVWVPVVLALSFWGLLGMAARQPQLSRYLFTSAVFLLLILLEFVRDLRLTRWAVLLGVGALLVSLVPNLINLNTRARQIRSFATGERAQLGALELLRHEVPSASIPYLVRSNDVSATSRGIVLFSRTGSQGFRIPARKWFAAVDRYGSPAASLEEVATGVEAQRLTVDGLLLNADDLTLEGLSARDSSGAHDCRSGGSDQPSHVPTAGLEIRPHGLRSDVTVDARRFAAEFQRVRLPGGAGPLVLRPARSQEVRPWLVQINGGTICAMR